MACAHELPRSALSSDSAGVRRIDPAIPILKRLRLGRGGSSTPTETSRGDGTSMAESGRELPPGDDTPSASYVESPMSPRASQTIQKIDRLLQRSGSSFCEELGVS